MAKNDFEEIEKGVYKLNEAISREIKETNSKIFQKKKK